MKEWREAKKTKRNKERKEELSYLLDNAYWEEIEEFNGKYIVSEDGLIINTKIWKQIFPTQSNGYCYVRLNERAYLLHRIVGKYFVPNPFNKPEINHRNGIRSDCRAINLEWMTHRENIQYSFDNLERKSNLIGWGKKKKITNK